MALRDFLSHPGSVATATPATVATPKAAKTRTVAKVATVAVASSETLKTKEPVSRAEPLDSMPLISSDRKIPDTSTPTDIRRQMALSMLAQEPDVTYAIVTDDEAEQDEVIMTLAIRGKATCELRVPKERYDGFAMLQILEKHAGSNIC